MKTRYEYIHFSEVANLGHKTTRWVCRNNRSQAQLGNVEWECGWRQYVFLPALDAETIWSAGCLDDVSMFLKMLNAAQREKRTTQ